MSNWLIIALALLTFGNRYLFLTEFVRYKPSAKLTRFLSFSMYAVLTAIWAPIVFQFKPNVFGPDIVSIITVNGVDYLLATMLAGLLAIFKFKSIIVVLSSSAFFFLLRFWVLSM